ncbi:DNA-binding helix-hairpin-helix protein with protein kinase domain [Labrenzia sp. EL_126]|nr:DNA-binding helix-hairpin-helix protein with protein kinase domain [Labrenzia sp. EL_126]
MEAENSGRELAAGDRFYSHNKLRTGVVGDLLGEGGQGSVYKSEFGGGTYALKWYHPYYVEIDGTLMERLRRAIARGAPDDRFLWPLELVEHPARTDSFGYVMGLRPDEFRSIRELLAPPPNRIELSLEKRLFVCQQIADSFLSLHAKGFCYQDINFGNFFVHPTSGRVLICDNDNVNVDGSEASVYGTRKFMAPEIVRRETTPNGRTDLYSMAVLFFYILIGWHPLDGKKEAEANLLTEQLEHELYGTAPLFLFDENDTSNGPVSPMHDMLVCRWRSLPEKLRSLFLRAFGIGLNNPNKRVIEKEWLKTMDGFQRATFACSDCRYEHIYDHVQSRSAGECVYCSTALAPPPMLLIGTKYIALGEGAVVTLADFGHANAPRWESMAIVVEHPQKPGVFGLKNTTQEPWRVRPPGGQETMVSPGKTVLLADGLRIEAGANQATVVAPDAISSLKAGSGNEAQCD